MIPAALTAKEAAQYITIQAEWNVPDQQHTTTPESPRPDGEETGHAS